MKVGLPEGGQVNARALPVDGGRVQRGYGDFGEVAQKFARAGTEIAKGIDEAKKQADTIAVTDAETGYQADITTALQGDTRNAGNFSSAAGIAAEDAFNEDAPTGFMFTKGLTAAERSTKTLDWLEQRRVERSKALANDEQKRLFEARTGGMFQDARRKVEGHVTAQRYEAAEASVAARKAAALNAVAKDPLGEDIGRLEAGPEGAIRQFALSKEDGDAKVRKWRGDVADTRIGALLSERRWQAAEQVLKDSAENLAPETVERFKGQIDKVREAADVERAATLAIETNRAEGTGRVDGAKARADALAAAPAEQREKVADLVDHKARAEERAWDQKVAERAAPVWDQLFKEKTLANVDPRMVDWLQKHAKDEWKALESWARQYRSEGRAIAAAGRARAGGGSSGATPEQAGAMLDFRVDVTKNPDKYFDMTVEQFKVQWGPRLSEKDFRAAGILFAGTKDNDRVSAGAFARYVNDNETAIKGKQGRDAFADAMGERYRAFVAKEKKQPTPDDLEAMRISATTEVGAKTLDVPFVGTVTVGGTPAYKAEREAKKKGQPPPAKPGKVWISGPGGKRGQAPEAGLDEWLKAHPGWKRE